MLFSHVFLFLAIVIVLLVIIYSQVQEDLLSVTVLSRNEESTDKSAMGLDEQIDYSRCPISDSSMQLYLYETSNDPLLQNIRLQFAKQATVTNNHRGACLFIVITNSTQMDPQLRQLPHWNSGFNHIIIDVGEMKVFPADTGHAIVFSNFISTKRSVLQYPLFLNLPAYDENQWTSVSTLLPYSRENLFTFIVSDDATRGDKMENYLRNFKSFYKTANIVYCSDNVTICHHNGLLAQLLTSSMFCAFEINSNFHLHFWESLRSGCIPVMISMDVKLPFDDVIDWSLATYRIPPARIPELQTILQSISEADVLALRRNGRFFFDSYLANTRVATKTILSYMRKLLGIPAPQIVEKSMPLFSGSYESPSLTTPSKTLGNMTSALVDVQFNSPTFNQNYTATHLYSYHLWNVAGVGSSSNEYFPFASEIPSEFHYDFDKKKLSATSNEQFTIVLLTYDRDEALRRGLLHLNGLPLLRSVVVVWNNLQRDPPTEWPKIHVPIYFVKATKNTLHNRFVPWDIIKTEAVFSLDDDVAVSHGDVLRMFRIWRDNRDRLVGLPSRVHAQRGNSSVYSTGVSCQYSLILTGAAFVHKWYLTQYSYTMPQAIRTHIDSVMNCEDIAMNFLVAHLTRKPPILTDGGMGQTCASCKGAGLSARPDHYVRRSTCIQEFTKIYGYNPLLMSHLKVGILSPQNNKCMGIP